MDFIIGLSQSEENTTIMVVFDRLTKYAHFGGLPAWFIACRTTILFVEIVIKRHGFPSSIVLDRDPTFMRKFWMTLFELSRTKLHRNIIYPPQTDGQTKVVNRGLEQYLRCFAREQPLVGRTIFVGLSTLTTPVTTTISKQLPIKLCIYMVVYHWIFFLMCHD